MKFSLPHEKVQYVEGVLRNSIRVLEMVGNLKIMETKNAKRKEGRLEEKGSILKMLRVSKCK